MGHDTPPRCNVPAPGIEKTARRVMTHGTGPSALAICAAILTLKEPE